MLLKNHKNIGGMALSVITAPENASESTTEGLGITIFGEKFELNEIWGKLDTVRLHICNVFHCPELFS